MKNLTFAMALFFSVAVFGQSEKQVFAASEITFYGLDFTQSKMIGAEGFTNPQEIVSSFFKKWNMIIKNEYKKYNLGEAHDKNVTLELDNTIERSIAVNADDIVVSSSHSISDKEISTVLRDLKRDQTEGVGLIYIVESFDKPAEKGSIYAVYFDIASNDVLMKVHFMESPGGFGIRNYWSNVTYEVIKRTKKEFYKKWAKGDIHVPKMK